MRIPVSRADGTALFIFTGALSASVGIGSERITALMVAVIFSVFANALMIGRVLLAWVPSFPESGVRPFAEYLLGLASLSAFIFTACVVLGISAGPAYLACCAVGCCALLYNAQARRNVDPWTNFDLASCVGITVTCLTWSWKAIDAVPTFRATGRFLAWSDYMMRSDAVLQFAYYAERGSRIGFYHFMTYMLPASLSALADVRSLVAVTAFWTPLGYVLMGLGAYCVGAVLAGRLGAIASAAALLLVPDAAHYGLKNAFYDFHWLQQIESAGAFTVGLALLATALVIIALRHENTRALWIAAMVSLALLGFRAHIFLPLGIAETLLLMAFWRPKQKWPAVAALIAIAFVGVGGVALAEVVPRAPHLFMFHSDPIGFTEEMLQHRPALYSEYFKEIIASVPRPLALTIGMVYLVAASCGLFLIAYLIGLVWCSRLRLLTPERWFPVAFIAAFLIVIAAVPITDGDDPYDLQHRQFVLLYAVLAVWSASFIVTLLTTYLPRHASFVLSAIGVCLLPTPFLLEDHAQLSMLRWAPQYLSITVPQSLIETGDFIREHSAPGDTVLLATNFQCGPLTEVAERRMIYPKQCDFRSLWKETTDPDLNLEPGSAAQQILQANDYDAFVEAARKLQFEWFVVYSKEPLASWVAQKAVWKDDGYFVLSALPGP